MRIRLKTLDEREFASTIIITSLGNAFTSGQWIAETVAEEFGCHVDDTGDYEDDDGEMFVTVHGKPEVRVIKEFGWRATA